MCSKELETSELSLVMVHNFNFYARTQHQTFMAPRLFTKDTKEYSIVHFRFYFQQALDKPRIQLTAILCLSISLNILKFCLVLIFGLLFNSKCPRCRDAYAGGRRGSCPL